MNVLLYFIAIISKKMEIKFICLVEARIYTTHERTFAVCQFCKTF